MTGDVVLVLLVFVGVANMFGVAVEGYITRRFAWVNLIVGLMCFAIAELLYLVSK